MARKNAQQVYKKWSKNLTGATQEMKDGANAVTVSPSAKAADKVDKWADGVARARADGTFEAACRAVTVEQWRSAYINKGVNHVADGVREAQPKMERFLGELLNYTQMVSDTVQAMPDNTPADRKARMDRAYELMSEFKSSRRR